MKVGIKQVAERAGVSATTVSHVVNKTRYVSPEVEKRVNDAIDELGYVPNIMARGLRTNTIKTVAVIVQEASTPFFSRVVDEISNVLYEEGYSLFLCTTRSQADDELNVFRSMLQQQVCGIILSPQQMDFDYRSLCPSKDFPIVFIDRRTNDIQGNTVTCDNYRVSYDAVKALVRKGHTQIGYIYSKRNYVLSTGKERYRGYRDALLDSGLPFDEKIMAGMDHQSFDSGYDAMKQLLQEKRATACFVAENPMAQGVFKCLADHHVAIPEEMALICFDDFEWSQLTSPALSTIRQPMEDMGKKAAELLLKKIKNPDGSYENIVLDSEIIMRKSC